MNASFRSCLVVGAVVAALFATAALAGCAFDTAPVQHVACESDRDCHTKGNVCALGVCVDPHDQRLSTVSFEIDPTNADLPVQDKLDVDLKASPRVDVSLRARVQWSGTVVHPSGEGESTSGVNAQVFARPQSSIPGRVLAPTASTDGNGAFHFDVVDGQRYVRAVLPGDPALPPLYFDTPLLARGDAAGAQDLGAVTVDDPAVVVTGVVKAGSGVEAQGVPALSVSLVDANGRRVSSVAPTAADGSFRLALAAEAVGLTLDVEPGENASFPSLSLDGIDAVSSDGSGTVDLGVVDLGDLATPVPFVARVKGADGAPVPGATAIVSAAIGNGTFTATLVAGSDGVINNQVPPGVYDIAAYGPAGAAQAALLLDKGVAVPSAADGLSLNLPARVRFSGTVTDPDGKPLAGAKLDAVRIGGVDDGPDDPLLAGAVLSFETSSGADGKFALDVDPARYRVSTRPPLGANAPPFSQLVTVPDAGLQRDVALPARAVVAGTVVFKGAAVPGAYVRVFTTEPLLDEQGNAILLGESAAGSDGGFELVVPDVPGLANDAAPAP